MKLFDRIKKHTPKGKRQEQERKRHEEYERSQASLRELEAQTQAWEERYHEECKRDGRDPHFHYIRGSSSTTFGVSGGHYEMSPCHLKPKM